MLGNKSFCGVDNQSLGMDNQSLGMDNQSLLQLKPLRSL
jgi:hypothetical protein